MSHSADAAVWTPSARWRFFEYRVDPVFWLLLGLAVLRLAFDLTTRPLDLFALPGQLAGVGPILLAATIALVARDSRLALLGALALAYGPFVQLAVWLYLAFLPQLGIYDLATLPTQFTWLFTVAGTVALALALGGIRSRFGWAVMLAGVAWAVVEGTWYLNYQANLGGPGLPVLDLVSSLAGRVVIIGWAVLLGSALGRGYRFIALGAALWLADAVLSWTIFALNLITPDIGSGPWNAGFGLIGLGTWLALIYGAITELKGPGWSHPPMESPA